MRALLTALAVAVLPLAALPARADDGVTVDALLILATNEQKPMDRRLERVEYQLRRIFKFEYFEHQGQGQARVNLPSTFTIDLGGGHELRISATGKDDRVRAEVEWVGDGRSLLRTTVNMKKGAHAILGGVPDKEKKGTLIVTLVVH